jgi:glycosyltransferase involved in cell wall biosynthesis
VQLDKITPLILTFNEEANIHRVLGRLAWAERIVVVDSFSTDATLDILEAYPNVVVVQRAFDDFASQCNFGLTHVESDWVLSLDADYVCPPELADELRRLPEDPAEHGYRVAFRYCIHGCALRGTLYPPRTVLYRRQHARYENDGHAHRVRVGGPVGVLRSRIDHDDRKPLDAWFAAQRRYAGQEAAKLLATPRSELGLADRLRLTKWAAPVLAPVYCLVAKGGLLDGRAGWTYALQRTYAEIALALALDELDHHPAGAPRERVPGVSSPPIESSLTTTP